LLKPFSNDRHDDPPFDGPADLRRAIRHGSTIIPFARKEKGEVKRIKKEKKRTTRSVLADAEAFDVYDISGTRPVDFAPGERTLSPEGRPETGPLWPSRSSPCNHVPCELAVCANRNRESTLPSQRSRWTKFSPTGRDDRIIA